MATDVTPLGIERRLTKIETTLETMLQAARAERKSDLHSLTRWMVVAVLGSAMAAAAITGLIVRFVGPATGG